MSSNSVTIRFTTLGALHITDGTTIYERTDYVPQDNKIYVLDLNRFFGEIDLETADKLLDLAEKSHKEYWSKVLSMMSREKHIMYELQAMNKKIFSEIAERGPKIIPFIKCAYEGKLLPFIPGSSIKGAIRTALLYAYLKNKCNQSMIMDVISFFKGFKGRIPFNLLKETMIRLIRGLGMHAIPDRMNSFESYELGKKLEVRKGIVKEKLEAKVKRDIDKDPFSLLLFSDSKPIDVNNLKVTKIKILGIHETKHPFAEILDENTSFEIQASVSHRVQLMESAQAKNFTIIVGDVSNPWTMIVEKVKEYARDTILLDMKIIDNILSQKQDASYIHVKNELQKLLNMIDKLKDNEFILPLGRFTGSVFKAIAMPLIFTCLRKDEREKIGLILSLIFRHFGYKDVHKVFPLTRKLDEGKGKLVGWVKGEII